MKLCGRNVDGDPIRLIPACGCRTCGLKNPLTNLRDQATLLRQRYKLKRRYHTTFRMLPPEQRLDAAFSVFEKMGSFHPGEPHWYLPLIGVDPSQQGRGYGSQLMKHALERCDREKTIAYLESSNPRNLSLYIRCGFELVGTIQLADSPPLFPMVRKPRN